MKTPPLDSLKQQLARLRPNKPLLVCETDGFSMRGAVIARTGSELVVLHAAESHLSDAKKGLDEVIANLKLQGWQGGGKVLLLTPDVVTALLELPADPNRQKTLAQMIELVQWEMEPLMLEQGSVWSVGRILVGMGYLSESQARDVISEQQLRANQPKQTPQDMPLDLGANSTPAMAQFKRFGDLALELGYITRQQLDDCLSRQGELKSDDDEYVLGWTPQEPKERDEDKDTYTWLASGISRNALRQWVDEFAEHDITIAALYPLVGSAVANLTDVEDGSVLLDVNGGMVAGIRFSANKVTQWHVRHSILTGSLETCLETWELLQPRDVTQLWLAESGKSASELAQSLAAVLDRKPNVISQKPYNGAAQSSVVVGPSMLGAVRHALNLPGAHFMTSVFPNGPKPAFWKRHEVRLAVAAIAVLVAILAAEVSLQVRSYIANSELEVVAGKHHFISQQVTKAQDELNAVKNAEDALNAVKAERDKLAAQLSLTETWLPKRRAMLNSLLDDLDKLVPDEVVIDRIEETPSNGFTIYAWAVSDVAAQRFGKSLSENAKRWNQKVVDVVVDSGPGRLGLQGYKLRLRLFTLPEVANNDANSVANSAEKEKGKP